MQKTKTQIRIAETIDSPDAIVPVEEQTTLRVAKELHEKLKLIAAFEGRTMMAIISSVLGDYCKRYESATGRSLTRTKTKAPKI